MISIWADPARKSCLALVAEDWKQLWPHVMSQTFEEDSFQWVGGYRKIQIGIILRH